MSAVPLTAAKYSKADLSPQDGQRQSSALRPIGHRSTVIHRAEKPTGQAMRTGWGTRVTSSQKNTLPATLCKV